MQLNIQLRCIIILLPLGKCITITLCRFFFFFFFLSHGYCSKMRCTGHLGLPHMIHSMCHRSTPGVTSTVFCLCGLNHYYKLKMWKMCEFDNSRRCMSVITLSAKHSKADRYKLRCLWD